MSIVNRGRLLALSDREFRRETSAPIAPQPASTTFRAMRVDLSKYDNAWDAKRGRAARLMAVLLREDDSELAERVCESPASSRIYSGAADWLAGEARYLRKVAAMMETAAGRLGAVLKRCSGNQAEPTTAGSES